MTTQTVTLRLVAENGQLVGTVRKTKAEIDGLGVGAQDAGRKSEEGFGRASRSAEKTSTFVSRARQAAVGFAAAFASIQGVRAAVGIADQYATITAQLRLATRSQSEYATAQAEVFSISQRTSTALDSTANLYARITRSTVDLGIEQARILALTETINQTFAVSGTSAVNQANAITQLTQAFAGGVLRAEEFNSVIENSPRLAQAIADGMGIGMGELRRQVNEGVVDVQRLIGALERQAETVAEEFSQMPLTIERAWVRVGNSITRFIGEQTTDTAGSVATALAGVSTAIDAVAVVAAANDDVFAPMFGTEPIVNWTEAWRAGVENAILFFARIPDFVRSSAILIVNDIAYLATSIGNGFQGAAILAERAWLAIRNTFASAVTAILSTAANMGDKLAGVFAALGQDDIAARLRGASTAIREFGTIIDEQGQAAIRDLDARRDALETAQDEAKRLRQSVQDQVIAEVAAREQARQAALGQASALSGVSAASDSAAAAGSRNNTVTTESEAAAKAAAKAWQDYQAELSKRADAYDDALFSVQDEIQYQTELNRLLRSGVSEAEAEAQARRAMEPIQSNAINAERDRLAALKASNAAIVDGREAQTEASRAAQEQARETAQAAQRAAADINRSLTDALLRGFESGQNFADNFFATLKNTAAALVLRPVIEFVLSPLSSVLGSIVGGGGGGLLSSLTGGGGGGLGQVASLFGGGVSLAQGASLGFQSGGVLGAAQGFADAALTNLGEGIANLGARFGSASAQSFGSSISASAGTLGNVLGAAGLGYLGGSTIGGLLGLSGDGQTGAGIGGALGAGLGSIVPGLGTLLGGAIGTALGGLVGSAFGGGSYGQDDLRLRGSFTDGDFGDASLTQYVSRKQSLGRGRRRRQNELDPTGFADALSDLFGNVFDAGTAAADRLGLAVSDFSFSIDESLNGLEGADLEARIVEIVSGASDALAEQLLPSLDRYQREGETSADTFFRLADSALRMQDALGVVNQTMNVTGRNLVMVSQTLLDQFGGSLEAFEASVGGFFERFYTDAEKFQRDRQVLDQAFAGIDISGLSYELPDSREGFREFVEGINLTLETGAEAYAVLTSLNEVADRYYATLEQREADRAELLGSVTGRIEELTLSAEALDLLRLDREFDALRDRADALDLDSTVIDQLYDLEVAARAAGGTVAELARQREAFEGDISGRLARQGLEGFDLESFNLEAEYSNAIAEAQRLGADLTAVETYFQGERNRIAWAAADEVLAAEQAAAEERARQAQAIASEEAGLLRELYQLQGDTVSLRAMEREALDASNQPLYDRIQALRDSATAEAEAQRATEARTQAAEQAVEAARRNAVAAYDAEIERLQGIVGAVADARSRVDSARGAAVSAYQRERSELEATAAEFRGLAESIAGFRTSLRGELGGPQAAAASAQQAFEAVARRARLGDRDALAQFPRAAEEAQASALANAATRQDYLDQLAAIDSAAAEAESVADRQASIAEDQLRHLDATAARLGLLNEQVETLDGAVRTLQSAEQALAAAEIAAEQAELQIEELQAARDGIAQVNTSVLSVGTAVSQLAVAQAQYASAVASGLGSLQSQISGLQAAQAARAASVPQFASGGTHMGGLRIVGERGPELEATGPSRILSNEQLRAILAGSGNSGGSNAELVALLREIAAQNASILRALTSVGITVERMEFRGEDWDINGLPQERAA